MEVSAARERGLPIMAETCPQYLFLSEDNYREPDFNGAKYVMRSGTLQVVATDYCPFFFKGQKDMGRDSFAKIPNGAPSIETRMILLFGQGVMNNRLSLEQFVAITATNPAKMLSEVTPVGINKFFYSKTLLEVEEVYLGGQIVTYYFLQYQDQTKT